MRHRVKIDKPVLVIGSTNEGVLSNDRLLPKKDVFPRQQREAYSMEKKDYKAFSKVIAEKVSKSKELIRKNRELELLARKNSARVIADSLNKVIINTTLA